MKDFFGGSKEIYVINSFSFFAWVPRIVGSQLANMEVFPNILRIAKRKYGKNLGPRYC